LSKKKTSIDKESSHAGELERYAATSARLSEAIKRDWASRLTDRQLDVLDALMGTLATLFENLDVAAAGHVSDMRAEYQKHPVSRYLRTLNTWLETKVAKLSADPAVTTDSPEARLLEKVAKLTASESGRLESIEVVTEKKNSLGAGISLKDDISFKKLNKQIETLLAKLEAIGNEIKAIKLESGVLIRASRESGHDIQKSIADSRVQMEIQINQVTNNLNSMTEQVSGAQKLLFEHDGHLREIVSKLTRLEEAEKTKIHLRDSIQILEIRRDIERFVTEDLLLRVSKAIMPYIGAMKELDEEGFREALDNLEEQCKTAGLYSVDKLYR